MSSNLEFELYKGLEAALSALRYVEEHYIPSYSAAAEMWSFVNGYLGNLDVDTILSRARRKYATVPKNSIAREVQAFVQLCGGAASFQKDIMPKWVNSKTRTIISKHDRLKIPLPVEPVWYAEEYEVPICEPFPVETIILHKVAWQWWSAPDGRRVYIMNVGFGPASNTIAFQQPPDYYLYPS